MVHLFPNSPYKITWGKTHSISPSRMKIHSLLYGWTRTGIRTVEILVTLHSVGESTEPPVHLKLLEYIKLPKEKEDFLKCLWSTQIIWVPLNSTIHKFFKTSSKIIGKRKRKQKDIEKHIAIKLLLVNTYKVHLHRPSVSKLASQSISWKSKKWASEVLIPRKSRLPDVFVLCNYNMWFRSSTTFPN